MFEAFKARAEAAGCQVVRFVTRAAALDFILQVLRDEGVAEAPGAYAVWVGCPFLDGVDTRGLEGKVPGLKFEVTRQLAKDARVGVTQMDWGIAGTGTLVQDSSAVEQRLASALTQVHVALIGTGRIVADLPALMARVHPRDSAYLAFITGPSRTADIERVLAIGVHGPERLLVVAVDGLDGEGA